MWYVNVRVSVNPCWVPLFDSGLGSSVSILSVAFDIKHYILFKFDFSDMEQEEHQEGMNEEQSCFMISFLSEEFHCICSKISFACIGNFIVLAVEVLPVVTLRDCDSMPVVPVGFLFCLQLSFLWVSLLSVCF